MTSAQVGDPVAAFLTACEVERREHRSRHRQHRLVSGHLISAEGGRFVYLFKIERQRVLKDELSIKIEVDGGLFDGTVVSSNDSSITVAFNSDLGREILKARLDTGELDLLQLLISNLRALQGERVADNNDRPRHLRAWNRDLATLALKLPEGDRNTADEERDEITYGAPSDLTAEQLDALNRSISQPVTFVWGPPGTGKSLLLAAIALKLYDDNKRVLIVSHTNNAVDGVLENICKRITDRGRKAISQGTILRLGTPVRGTFIERFGDQVALERVVSLSQEKVAGRLVALQQELASVREEIFSVARRLTFLDTYNQILGEIRSIERGDKEPEPSFVSALKGALFGEISRERSVSEGAKERGAQELIELLHSGLDLVEREVSGCHREELQLRSAELSSRQLELAEGVLVLERFIRDVRENILSRGRIIASTATTAMMSAAELGEFDAVLIDEGSMLPLPLAYLVSGMARERVVIAGDFRQLPAIAHSNAPVVAKWYSRDIFECAGVIDLIESNKSSPAVRVLKTQFRSSRELCDLINKRFYSGFLRTVDSGNLAERYIYRDPLTYLNRYPVVLIDSSELKPWGETQDGSKFNILHGLLVRKLALILSAHGLSLLPESIGVIAPYRAQVELIRSLLAEVSLDRAVSVGTVHRFQGNERDLIILDLTDGAPHNLGVFFNPLSLRDLGARLINVALSRARRNLIVVADIMHLRRKLSPESLMWGVLDDIEENSLRLPAREVIGEQVVQNPSIEVRSASGVLAFQSFNEQLFLPALVTDLLAAQSEVLITCSIVAESDSIVIGGILEQILKRKIRVKVIIANSGALSYQQTSFIDRLKKIGVRVVVLRHMVAPAVVIDREVLWLGSKSPLDSLSSAGAKMARAVSLEAAKRALEVLRGEEDSSGNWVVSEPRAV